MISQSGILKKIIVTFLFVLAFSADSFAQGGNTCTAAQASPIAIGTKYSGQTTCSKGNDYVGAGGCLTNYTAQDWIYYFCPTQSGYVNFSLENVSPKTGTNANPNISIFNGCPGSSTCLVSGSGIVSGSTTPASLVSIGAKVTAGQCYYLLVDGSNAAPNSDCINFNLTSSITVVAQNATCVNMDFEQGNLNGWFANTGTVVTGPAGAQTPTYNMTGYTAVPGRHTIVGPGGTDPCGGFPLAGVGSKSLRLGNNINGAQGEQVSQTFLVSKFNANFTYRYAVVFEDPKHTNPEQPFFTALVRDQSGNIIQCSKYIVTAGDGIPGFVSTTACAGTAVKYKPWSVVNVDLTAFIGTYVTIEFTTGDCTQSGHYGYAYVDAQCGTSLISQNDTICSGECSTLQAPAGYASYLWQPGGSTATSLSACPTATTVYTLSLTGFNGCVTKATDTVYVRPKPVADFTFSTPGCNQPINFTNTSTVPSPSTITKHAWIFQGGSPATSSSQSPTGVTWSTPGTYTVTLTETTESGCTATVTKTVVVPACTISVLIQGDTVCQGACHTITASPSLGVPPYTYAWNPSIGAGPGPHQVCPTATTVYSVTMTDAQGNTASDTAIVTVIPPMTITFNSVNPKCFGGSDGSTTANPASGLAPYTYSWNPPAGGTTQTVSGLAIGSYVVTVTDAKGCTFSSSVALTEPSQVTVTVVPTPAPCGTGNGAATATAGGGTGSLTYTWSNGVAGPTVSGLIVGIYTVTVTDQNLCSQTSIATIGNNPSPSIDSFTGTNLLCAGDNSGSVAVSASGGTIPYTYIWSNGGPSGSASITGLAAGTYTVSVTDASGCAAISTVSITEPPPIVAGTTATSASCSSLTGTATVNSSGGSPGYTYSWNDGQTTLTATGLGSGVYTVEVTDANGCSITQTASVGGSPTVTLSLSPSSVKCFGDDTTLTVTVNTGTPGYSYSWSDGQTTSTATGLKAGSYSVVVTDAIGCTSQQTATITEPTALTTDVLPVSVKCFGDTTSAIVTAAGGTPVYTFSWSNGQNTAAASGLDATTTYTVLVTDNNGCTSQSTVAPTQPTSLVPAISATSINCYGGTTSIATSATGGTPVSAGVYSYSWSTGQTTDTVSALAGTYTVTISDANGCTISTNITVTEPPPVTLVVPAVGIICIGQSATLTATMTGGTPAYSYLWMPGSLTGSSISVSPVTKTIYTVSAMDANGCTAAPQTVEVDVRPSLLVDAGLDQRICIGDSATFNAVASGGDGNYTYIWLPVNVSGPTLTVIPAATATYTVVVTDGCGTPSASDSVQVIVNPLPVPYFVADTTKGCVPLCVRFSNTTSGALKSCSWEFGDGGQSLSCDPVYCYRKDGIFSVKLDVIDTNGCAASVSRLNYIEVYPLPDAAFKLDPRSTSILAPTITFTDGSSSNVVKWDWNFGDVYNSSSDKKNPTFTYKDSGRYEIQLVVTTQYGCVDTAFDYVIIQGDYTFYVPNAFSPNGDGTNETFFPKGFMIDPECYRMHIFDRWGLLIFTTNNLDVGWNGKVRDGDEIAQQDVYVWKIETCDYLKRRYKYIGHVTLVR